MQRYPCMFMHRVTTIYIFCYTFCNDKRNYMTMGHKNDKVKNLWTVSQIFTSVKEITLVMWMLHAWTPLDHMYVNVMLDILETEKTAQVNLISSLQYNRIVLHDTFDYSAAPSSCVARQLDNLSLRNSVILSSRVHLLECSSRYLMRI